MLASSILIGSLKRILILEVSLSLSLSLSESKVTLSYSILQLGLNSCISGTMM
uniref:Uncharacterized protein n=1 Tax=Arundo donax TaxID=35708 RepID=A0A0A9EJN9_ARUDO